MYSIIIEVKTKVICQRGYPGKIRPINLYIVSGYLSVMYATLLRIQGKSENILKALMANKKVKILNSDGRSTR